MNKEIKSKFYIFYIFINGNLSQVKIEEIYVKNVVYVGSTTIEGSDGDAAIFVDIDGQLITL